MGFSDIAEYKIGRRFRNNNGDVIELTGRKQDGSYTYSLVDPKTGYLMKGFGGTIAAKPKNSMKDNPENPMVQIVDESESDGKSFQDDPNDGITSVNEYSDATFEEGDEPVTPYEIQKPINKSLERLGRIMKSVGIAAGVAGTFGGVATGIVIAPWIGLIVVGAGLASAIVLNFTGNKLRRKSGVFYKKVYTA